MQKQKGKFRPLFVMSLFALTLALASCSSGGGGGNDSDSPADQSGGEDSSSAPGTLRVTTFNTGLLPYLVPLSDERVAPVASAAASHDADVLCLQEVWQESDRQTVSSALARTYPNIFSPAPHQKFAMHLPVCSASDLAGVGECVVSNCLLGSGFFECLLSSCRDETDALAARNPECAQALTAQAGRSASDILSIQEELFSETVPARLFAFDGSSGVLLASKLPLENVETVDFYDITTATRRAGVLATVTKDGVAQRIGCTHLQSNFDGLVPYTGRFGSWEGEHSAQARAFRAAAEGSAGNNPILLAGDFNCSIAASGVVGEFEPACREFLSAGYSDPAASAGRCTFCASNSLNQQNSSIIEARDTLLDHVFTKGAPAAAAEIVFQAPVSAGGQSTNLSDHFGARVSIASAP